MKVNAEDIVIKKVDDYYVDLSWLGKFSDTPEEGAIDHRARSGDRCAYRWFNPANPEYAEEEYKRMMEFERGWVNCIGIKAEIKLKIPMPSHGSSYFILQTIDSPGQWGIESDSNESYFEEVFEEEKRTLIHMLQQMGIEVEEEKENELV